MRTYKGVRTDAQLWELIHQGYHLYPDRRWNTWIIKKGRKDQRYVAKHLNPLCAQLAPLTRARKLGADQVQQLRMAGNSIAQVAEQTGLSRSGVYKALDKSPQELVQIHHKPGSRTAEPGPRITAGSGQGIPQDPSPADVQWLDAILSGIGLGLLLGWPWILGLILHLIQTTKS